MLKQPGMAPLHCKTERPLQSVFGYGRIHIDQQVNKVLESIHGHDAQGRIGGRPALQAGVDIRPLFHQGLHDLHVFANRCGHERSPAQHISGLDIRPGIEKEGHDLGMSSLASEVKGRLSPEIAFIERRGALFEQQVGDFQVAQVGGVVKRRGLVLVFQVYIRALADEMLGDICVARLKGEMEGRFLVLIRAV